MRRRSRLLAVVAWMAITTACVSTTSSGDDETEVPPGVGEAPNAGETSGVTIVTNGAVYTVDTERSQAQAFAFDEDGIIIAVGSDEWVRTVAGSPATVIDAGGRMILPGFQDVHVHVPEAGINLEVCLLEPGLTLEDYEFALHDCAEEQPTADWVRAAGASLFDLRTAYGSPSGELPIDVLDRIAPDRPAIVLDDLGHAAWTNSLGLAAAGIADDAADPQGGVFHRDSSGRLTGLLLEDAQQAVRNAAAPDDDTTHRGLLVALEELARNGITAVSDAGGYWGQNHPAAWQRADRERELTVRAANTLYAYPSLTLDQQLAEFARRFANDSDMLRFDTAKVYVDGILDLGTAAMLRPYIAPIDPNLPLGFRYFDDQQLQTLVAELHDIGYRVSFHAVGDAAVRSALDAVEAIPDSPEAIADRRHRITHTYLVDAADAGRFAQLGVIADFQQGPDAVDPSYHELLTELIADEALDLIPTARVFDAGATVTLSSDWDADPLSPLGTIERALTRDSNAVADLATAIEMATINAAYALGHDDTTGSIEVGKFADFVILSDDLFDLDHSQIDQVRVDATYMGGVEVFAAR